MTVVLASMLVLVGCATALQAPECLDEIQVNELPAVGQRFIVNEKSDCLILLTSASIVQSYTVVHQGTRFTIGLPKGGEPVVVYINVSDKAFQSPEGLRVGDSLCSALQTTETKPVSGPGFSYTLLLPSGWKAGFDALETNGMPADNRLTEESRISWFSRD